jgi:enamine deaminase RidA (YjgF/YER057c/UK114 family)
MIHSLLHEILNRPVEWEAQLISTQFPYRSQNSGHGPLKADGTMITGRVGVDTDLEGGYASARQTGLAILATLRSQLGSLDRIKRVIKTLGMVNAAADFSQHPQVINGFSELMRDVFGEDNGVGARSAVGMGSLPDDIAVEIEMIVELRS